MPVNHYVWGEAIGGSSDSGGSVVPAAASFGPQESFSGTLLAANVTITFAKNTKQVSIYNTDDNDYMEVSFDGGTNWVPIDPNGHREEQVSVASIVIRRVGANPVTYTVVAVLQS